MNNTVQNKVPQTGRPQNRQPQSSGSIDYDYLISLLWKHASLLILVGILCGALAFGYARVAIAPQYEGSVLFFVNSSSFNVNNALNLTSGNANMKVGNYLNILKSRANLEAVIEKSGTEYTYKQLRKMISAEAIPDTDLIQVTVTSRNPEYARVLANAVADILPEKVAEITASTSLEVVDYAETPESRTSPNYITYAEYGFIAGLALCAAVILAVAWFDDTIRGTDYLEQSYPIPLIAEIPDLTEKSGGKYGYYYGNEGAESVSPGKLQREQEDKGKKKRSSAKKPAGRRDQPPICDELPYAGAEAYKLLRTNLLFALPEKSCCILGITSSVRGEGKSTTAVNLSYSFAQAGKRVLLIDADMRLPSVNTKMKIKKTPGLSNLIVGMNSMKECLHQSEYYENWFILPAGDNPPNPLELLGSEKMHSLLDSFAEVFDYILLDLPPVNLVADALIASKWTDGIVTVVRQNYTERKALRANINQAERLGVKELGFVLTFAAAGVGYYKRYGKYGKYGYGYGYGSEKPDKAKQSAADRDKTWEFLDAVADEKPRTPSERKP